MQQSESEENVIYEHNLKGMAPSHFEDVKDPALRTYNRGAVLANIFERYVDQRTGKLMSKDLVLCMREIHEYLSEVPESERNEAHASMFVHLEERGYRECTNINNRH